MSLLLFFSEQFFLHLFTLEQDLCFSWKGFRCEGIQRSSASRYLPRNHLYGLPLSRGRPILLGRKVLFRLTSNDPLTKPWVFRVGFCNWYSGRVCTKHLVTLGLSCGNNVMVASLYLFYILIKGHTCRM